MKKNITTLREIEIEQKKLKATMKITKEAFIDNLGTNRHQLKEFFIKKIAIPGGAIGLGLAAITKAADAFSNRDEDADVSVTRTRKKSSFFDKLFPFALGFAQTYLAKWWAKEEVKEDITTNTSTNLSQNMLKKVV